MCAELTSTTEQPMPVEVQKELEPFASRIAGAAGTAVRNMIEIGGMLSEAREILARKKCGQYEWWLESCVGISKTTAFRCVSAWRAFQNVPTLERLADTGAVELVAAPSCPPEAVDEVEKLLTAGEVVTRKRVKAIISSHKPDEEKFVDDGQLISDQINDINDTFAKLTPPLRKMFVEQLQEWLKERA